MIKESVLGCLLDCLPVGVNRERISSSTMKEAYVQKMVKVFNEHDKWSLISLSNNSGKNLELKFVSSLRRQFEFSVDSFQIILDRLLESYMQEESQQKRNAAEQVTENQSKDSSCVTSSPETEESSGQDLTQQRDEKESQTDFSQQTEHSTQTKHSKVETDKKEKNCGMPTELKELSRNRENSDDASDQTTQNPFSEKKPASEKAEPQTQVELRHEPELMDEMNSSVKVEQSELTQSCDDQQPAHTHHKELSLQNEPSNLTKPPAEEKEITEKMEQSESPETSNKTPTELLKQTEDLHSTELSDKTDFTKCCIEDQRSNEKDKTHLSLSECSTSSQSVELADERKVESEEQMTVERKNYIEKCERTEEILAPEAINTQGNDSLCPTSTISLTLHNTQPAGTQYDLKGYCTLQTEKSPNTVDAVSSSDTQDITHVPPSPVSDKKSSSSPSCKASDRLSHMVVLKHSSPKPPRRMCRKVVPSLVSESEPTIAPCLDPNPLPSLEPETNFNAKPAVPISDSLIVVPSKTSSGPETSAFSDPASNQDFTSAPNLAPDISTTAVKPISALQTSSQIITESLYASIQSLKETLSTSMAFDDEGQPSLQDVVSASKQSEPLASMDPLMPLTDTSCTNTPEPEHTSQVELSDDDENQELRAKKMNLNQPNSSPQETTLTSPSSSYCVTPPVSCLTPPLLSFSPPCFTPSPPNLSPPLCLSPPSPCLTSPMLSSVSPATSFSSPPLSFSPTSSSLSSPPYLTPPMLSLSPPPLCLTPPSPCLSPPLVCLTTPVESEDLVPQVSSDMEPLIINTVTEEQIKESSVQPGIPLLQLEDKNEQDYISSLPLVSEPVSFPITIPSSTSDVLPHSQSGVSGESAPPNADVASSSVPENREAPEITADVSRQCNSPQASGSVPAVEVLAESMYGDFEAAMDHLRYRLIATRNPEEIRGGGLLKYSNLLVRDYRPASETQIKTLERYMCSRFFIDFPDVQEQQRKILSYLKNHFIGEERSKYQYLMTLRRVVDDSTVCLMGHERRQTLNMITVLALKVLGEQNIIPNTDHVTCFYQPAPYLAEHNAPYLAEPSYCSYYIPQGGSALLYQPYPLHLHTQTGLV